MYGDDLYYLYNYISVNSVLGSKPSNYRECAESKDFFVMAEIAVVNYYPAA